MWMLRAIGRGGFIASIYGIGFFILGLMALKGGWEYDRAWRAARKHELIRLPLDLSEAADHNGTLDHTYAQAHVALLIQVDPPFESAEEANAALEGLACRVRLKDDKREREHDGPTLDDSRLEWADPEAGRELPIFFLYRFAKGQYGFSLEVAEPAPALAGRQQVLIARYCRRGVGQMLATTYYAVGGSFVGLSLLLAALIWWRVNRTRRRVRAPGSASRSDRHVGQQGRTRG